MSRSPQITPDMAGLPFAGADDRRVPGLRREEVAMLAGVSVEYYTRLERGKLEGSVAKRPRSPGPRAPTK